MKPTAVAALLILPALCLGQTTRSIEVHRVPGTIDARTIELRGLAAGAFDPKIWQAGTLHLLPDARSPMLEPQPGKFRNIYAPSAVQTPYGWKLFYGAWDGIETGNDHIYSVDTPDFLTFENRQILVQPGTFQHICNVSAVATSVGAYAMFGTLYPDERGLNKPAVFFSRDGKTWNDVKPPYTVKKEDIVKIAGYEDYAGADINGMNVMLYEDDRYSLYFGNFKDFDKVYRASSHDGHQFVFEGKVLGGHFAPNDVKKFRIGKENWYLMGLHMNTGKLWYSLSNDATKFPPAQVLFEHGDTSDAFMVAVGFVVQGGQEFTGRRLLGVLYGAGAKGSLDANRIFARWLQRRAMFVTDGKPIEATRSLGPNRQVLSVDANAKLSGHFEIYGEDGKTPLGSSDPVNIEAGHAYVLTIQ